MPALILFNRRTILGGDDLQPTCMITVIVRCIQLLFLCIPILHYSIVALLFDLDDNNNSNNTDTSSSSALLFFSNTESSFLSKEVVENAWLTDVNSGTTEVLDCQNGSSTASIRMFHIFISIWISTTIMYNIISIVLEHYVLFWSNYGTPTTEIQIRSYHLQKLLQFKLIPWTIILFGIWIIGIFGIVCYSIIPHFHCTGQQQSQYDAIVQTSFRHRYGMPLQIHIFWLAIVILSLSQMLEIIVSIMFTWQLYQIRPINDATVSSSFVTYDNRPDNLDDSSTHYNHELVEEMWAERCAASCQCLSVSTCYMFGGRNLVDPSTSTATSMMGASVFSDVARALADFMESRGVLNVVPSDIVTGLVILQRIQCQRIYKARQQYIASTTTNYIERSDSATFEAAENGIVTRTNAVALPPRSGSSTIRKRSSTKILMTGQQEDGLLIGSNMTRSESYDDVLLPLEEVTVAVPTSASILNRSNRENDDMLVLQTTVPTRNYKPNVEGFHSVYRIDPSGGYHREERALLNRTNFHELYLLDEAARYAKYALAIYTWVLYLYVHPITGPFRLLASNSCRFFSCDKAKFRHRHYEEPTQQERLDEITSNVLLMQYVDENGRIEGDNICQTNKNAILLTVGLTETDIVYVQLRSSLSDIPYCILVDHAWKAIIVSIRGTFSIEDCVTDVLITPESLEQLGEDFGFDAVDQYCHGGVMSCARNVYRDLERHGLLDTLLLGEQARYSGYTLRLIGHSLGAATSTLLSYMLRPKFPNLRCINYSPPGCTFTWRMATQCKDWCTSCVLDTDLVPRLTVESIERLRDEILDLIGRIKVPKAVIARRFTENTFRICTDQEGKTGNINTDMADILYDHDEIPDSEYQQQLIRFKEIQEERRRQRGTARSINIAPRQNWRKKILCRRFGKDFDMLYD
jgi:Lipase (class 3)